MNGAVPIARPRDVERDVHREPHPDDLLFRLAAQRNQDLDRGFVVRPQAEMEHAVQEVEELRARVRERFRVDAVVTADEITRRIEFRIVAGKAIEDEVASRDVSFGRVEEDAVLEALLPEVVDLFEEWKIHAANRCGPGLRGQRPDRIMLPFRPPEVVERERPDVPALLLRPPQRNGRIDPARQENDRPFHSVTAKSYGPSSLSRRRPRSGRFRPINICPRVTRLRAEKDFKPRAAAAGGTAARELGVRPRSLRETRPARSRDGPRTGRR